MAIPFNMSMESLIIPGYDPTSHAFIKLRVSRYLVLLESMRGDWRRMERYLTVCLNSYLKLPADSNSLISVSFSHNWKPKREDSDEPEI